MTDEILSKYAHVVLKSGVQLKKGQNLFVTAPLEAKEFVRVLTREAYGAFHAAYVKVFYVDTEMRNVRARYSDDEYLSYVPEWEKEYAGAYSKKDCCNVKLVSGELLSSGGASADALGKVIASEREEISLYRENQGERKVSWIIAAYPSQKWAELVYPEIKKENALDALWADFIKIYKLDKENPADEWLSYRDELKRRKDKFNEMGIKALHLKSETMDINLELCKGEFMGGSAVTYDNTEFMGNIPTHEVFNVPNKYKVNGYVKSTMPLNYNGKVIEGIYLEFKDGKVINYDADKNRDMLEVILNVDEGSSRLGEVGLVSVESEIYRTGRVFYTTLFDENAVTHLALGNACESCVSKEKMTDEEADSKGANRSSVHIDFMVGSESLTITAYLENGSEVNIMENGKFLY